MLRSMTGFGIANGSVGDGRLHVELRSVNHRHLQVQLKLPPALQALESDLRLRLRERLARGHVTLAARWIEEPRRAATLSVNVERARELLEAVRAVQRVLELPGDIDVGWIMRQPEVLAAEAPEEAPVDAEAVYAIVGRALEALLATREAEGEALRRELAGHLETMLRLVHHVEARAPDRVVAERDRLRRAVATLLNGAVLDEARLAQEIALLAERVDVAEEIARLKTHLGAAETALGKGEPSGRQLGFLAQEMLREINTIGSKASDAPIQHAVIAMKGELEKFREQVENVE